MKKLRVYLAGPISKGDRGHNLAQFISWHEYLMTAGFAVFNPGLSMLLPWAAEKNHTEWMEADIPFVLQSDLVVRLPGESVGADQEVVEAMKAGIPVYFAPEKPADKPRSLSLERFVREAKALVSDGYVFVDPSKPIENGTMYRLLQNFRDTFSVSKAQAFGSGIRTGLAIAVKPAEAKPASPRPEVAAGTAAIEVNQPESKFKKGDRVQVNGPSTHQFYSGPFPAKGTVQVVYTNTAVKYDVRMDVPNKAGAKDFTFAEANLAPLTEDPVEKLVRVGDTSRHDASIPAWVKPGHRVLEPDDIVQKGDLAMAVDNGYLVGGWVPFSSIIGMKVSDLVPDLVCQRPMKGLKPQPDWVPGGYIALEPGSTYRDKGNVLCNAISNFEDCGSEGGWVGSGWIPSGIEAGKRIPDTLLYCIRKVTKEDTDPTIEPEKPKPYTVDHGPFAPVVVGAPGNVFAIPQPGHEYYNKGKAPDPGPGFRLLHPDELVKAGDELQRSYGWETSINWQNTDKKQAPEFWYRRPNSSAMAEDLAKTAPAEEPDKSLVKDAKGQSIQVGDTIKILVDQSLGGFHGTKDQVVKVEKISEWFFGEGMCVEAYVPGHPGRRAFRPGQVEIVKPVHQLPADYIGPVTVDGRTMRLAVPGDEGKKAWAGFPDKQPGRSGGLVWIVKSIARDCKATLTPDSTWSTLPDIFPAAWVVDEPEPVPAPAPAEPVAQKAEEPVTSGFKKFSSGAVRSSDADNTRFDLISPIGLERLAMTCAEGAKKYGDHNWTKGMPVSECLNHCLRHVNMYLAGDKTEDHMAHAAWNLFAVMHFEKTRPDLVDVPTRKESK